MDLDTLGVDEVAVCLRSITGRSFSVLKPQMGGHVISGPFILEAGAASDNAQDSAATACDAMP